ncbi:hypothetical protein [Tenacibaculum sp. UWU-22]|uniref:hypothetical protein n=1 Tax=Tenacibaculum sp. UWU-22 TaxID=3234187 RepID=UPI0034DB7311
MNYTLKTNQNFLANNTFYTFSFERYSLGATAHDAIRAFNTSANLSYQIDIYKGDGRTTNPSQESSSAIITGGVHLKMIDRNRQNFINRYGQPTAINQTAHVSQNLLWKSSACVFARYLDRYWGHYDLLFNNCKNFCNELIQVLQEGEISIPEGFILNENPISIENDPQRGMTYNWSLSKS